ncbi:MAG: hypothetical protein M3P04_13355 [Actinomycetota bacterium]|nr:hypothetical protein [Actinomycetota bacterium]
MHTRRFLAATLFLAFLGTNGPSLSRGTDNIDERTAAYPTRCVQVTLPPDGRPLPEVCIVYPL